MKKIIISFLILASGFRAPNLAELTSFGVHHGSNRFEIGNPDLESEQNFQMDLSMESGKRHIDIGLGIPSEPVFYYDPKTKMASVIVQKSDSEIVNKNPNLKERPMLINSWRDR